MSTELQVTLSPSHGDVHTGVVRRCRICGSRAIEDHGAVGRLPFSLTSEEQILPVATSISSCGECGHLQKFYSRAEAMVIERIYANYNVYHLSDGQENPVFAEGGQPTPRSSHAIENIREQLPSTGRMLDVGVGKGAFLEAASRGLPAWDLIAYDLSDLHRERILNIHNVHEFHSGPLENLALAPVDLIVVWHVIEHVPDPIDFLKKLKGFLAPQGRILLQVPDLLRDPFDLAVIDHCSHFSNDLFRHLVDATGFQTVCDGYGWFRNYCTLLIEPVEDASPEEMGVNHEPVIKWLNETVSSFEEKMSDRDEFALFGAGTASLWTLSQLSRKPACILDEDEKKQGHVFQGIEIRHPREGLVPSTVLVPFHISNGLQARLQGYVPGVELITIPGRIGVDKA